MARSDRHSFLGGKRGSQRVIEPIKVEGGYVTAYDHARDEVRTFAIHRITGVAELQET